MNINQTINQATPLKRRVMRWLGPAIVISFLLIGIIGVFGVQNGARQSVQQVQDVALLNLTNALLEEFDETFIELREAAGTAAVQEFAQQTIALSSTQEDLEAAQTALLTELLALLENHPGEHIAVRYVMNTGSVWTEVNFAPDGEFEIDRDFRLRSQSEDSTLSAALRANSGDVVLSRLQFISPTESETGQLTPFFRFAAPVTRANDQTVLGAVQLDVFADNILDVVNRAASDPVLGADGRRYAILNNRGDLLADSEDPLRGYLSFLSTGAQPELDATLAFVADSPNTLETVARGQSIISTETISVGFAPDMPWHIVLIDNSVVALGNATLLSVSVLFGSVLLGAAIVLFADRLLTQMLRPVGTMSTMVQQIATGQAAETQGTEADTAIDTLQTISRRIQTLTNEIDSQNRLYSRNMSVAARISRETAALADIDAMLERAVDLICDSFGLYHAQVFLVDDAGVNAVLVYSRGELGKRLLAVEHRLPVGSRSVIGRVTSTSHAVVVNDTHLPPSDDRPHIPNPLLPDTRAEMALPLVIGEEVIGALDLQSDTPNVFTEEDQQVYQLIADQIAISLYRTRLLRQSDERIHQIELLNRQLTKVAFDELEREYGLQQVYRYNLLEVETGQTDIESYPTAEMLMVPITIRGQVIGTISAAPPQGQAFTSGDHTILNSVAERVALAMENARLFEETQRNLAETNALYQTARFLSEAGSVDEIIESIVRSALPAANAGLLATFDDFSMGSNPEWVKIIATWQAGNSPAPAGIEDLRLHVPDHELLLSLHPNQVTLVEDVARDNRLDDQLLALFRQLNAQSLVFIPLSRGGNWSGVMVFGFPMARTFSQQEGRIFDNIADQAGITIENSLLLQETENALAQNERLYSASRIINQGMGAADLVRAAVKTTDETDLRFGLGSFEGDLDETSWPTRIRIMARSSGGTVLTEEEVFEYRVPSGSPMRDRGSEILLDKNPDDAPENGLIEMLRANGDRFGVAFPLFSANRPIAVFFVMRNQMRDLSEEDYEIYRALSGQMSTVLENRRLLDQTERALDETQRLYEASRAITDAPDTAVLYQTATQHLASLPQLNRVVILLASPEPTPTAPFLEYTYVWDQIEHPNAPKVGTRIDQRRTPLSRFVRSSDGLVRVADTTALDEVPAIAAMMEERSTRSFIGIQLEARQMWLGLMLCESFDVGAFSVQYQRFAQAIADQIATSLENLILFEQAQQEAQQALALADAGQLASQVGADFSKSVNMLFTRLEETAGYDRWLLLTMNASGDALNVVIERAPESYQIVERNALRLTETHSAVDAVVEQREITVNDPETYPAFERDSQAATVIGKHIAVPLVARDMVIGALVVGRGLDQPDLTRRDEVLISTLGTQVAISLENRRLFRAAEQERGTLRSILNTLPAGVLVLDAETLQPVQFNAQMQQLLQREVPDGVAYSAETYNLYRTGTQLHYPNNELPIFVTRERGTSAFSDDISVIGEDGHQVDLLINAAPILDEYGNISSIVAAFEDISNLRSLENTLQDNLRETIALYEATRSLSEVDEFEQVLDVVLSQMMITDPHDAHVLLLDETGGGVTVERSLVTPLSMEVVPEGALNPQDTIAITDVSASPQLSEAEKQRLATVDIHALLTVPLRASNREVPLGWLMTTYAEPHIYTPEQERFMTTLGDNAAVAIDNRYLFESTERALRETMALYGATTAVSGARDLNELASVVRGSLESLSPDVYAAYLMTDPATPYDLTELFNISLDGPPMPFEELLTAHDLFRDEAIYIEDAHAITDPTAFELSVQALGNVRALASVSLKVKGMPDGRMIIGYHEPRRFTDSNVRYLGALADGASVVVDNIILLEQIQNALEETSTLYQASRALADAVSPEDILDVVVEKLIGVHVNQVFVALLSSRSWEASGATVQVVSSWQRDESIDLSGISLSAEQFPAWPQLASQQVITIDDIHANEAISDLERMGIESLDTRALAVIPLRVTARSIGAIWIGSREPHRHNEREQRIYQAFAEQASLSLEASFLLEQTERRARQLATSAEVSQIATSILEIDRLLPRVVDLIQDQFGYDHVQIFLMDDEFEYAELRASTGEPGKQLLAIKHKLQRGSASVIGQVTEQAKPIIALDTSDARVTHRPNPYLPLTRSEMALPIIIKGEVVGALDVQSNQANAFGDDDVGVLTTLAAQISVAIDNARLFTQSERRADEMSFLFTITTAAASADTIDEALQNVVELMRGSLESLSVGVYLAEERPELDELVMKIVALAGSLQPLSEVEEVMIGDQENVIGSASADLTPTIVNDVRKEPRYLPLVPEARSAIVVPLNSAGEAIAVVVMEANRTNAYNQDTLTLLLALGGTLAAIIQNALLVEEVQRSNEQLRELDRLKSDFLANMSHELRTPLNSIIGFSRVMLKGIDGELTEMQEQDLTTIYNSGQHLLGLINDILDSAKIAANKMDLQQDFFDIKPVIEGVRSIGIGLLKEKPVDIHVKMANNLPQAFGDEFRTRQVLLNLVSNAAKFTNQGTITLSVYLERGEKSENFIRIDVADTGIGIDQKDMPLLFEAFRQVDSSLTRTVGGTGLGLPIAKSLVEMQGGEMVVESIVGEGSTFTITVPTQRVELAQTGALSLPDDHEDGDNTDTVETSTVTDTSETRRPSKLSGPPPGVFQQKRQVLLIEDLPDMVDQFRRGLQREGFEVFAATIPLEAEAMASGLRPTVIVMDVNFSNGAGWDILAKVKDRDDTFDIPVIVVTLSDETEQAYQLGAHKVIQRPFMPENLVEDVVQAEAESNVDRILIIDDQPESARILQEALQEKGKYRIFAAHTGPEGISLVARRRPDLIILDLRMPEMDGFAVLEELRARPETASIPVIIVTGDTTFSEDERDQLTDLEVLYKADLNQDNYEQFIGEVRDHLARYHGE